MIALYIARRLGEALITLLTVGLAVFLLLHLMPYNVAAILAGPQASPSQVAQVAAAIGQNLPLPMQFIRWLGQLAAGGFYLAVGRAMPTLELLALGSGLAMVAALGLGWVQVHLPDSLLDRVASSLAFVLYTLPSFWIGFILIYFFAIDLLWLPAQGPSLNPPSQQQWLLYMILPVVTLALTTIATWSTSVRAAIEESLRSDYVRTARAKGASERAIFRHHVLRNVLLPLITTAGMSLPTLFNNVIAIEWLFTMRGLGSGLIDALTAFDYGTAIDLVFVIGAVTVLGSLLADLLYLLADPRIQYR
jgi:peptide/nickel transport system permease protein